MRERVILVRRVLHTCPDGSSIETLEQCEVLIEWDEPLPKKAGYSIPGPWMLPERAKEATG